MKDMPVDDLFDILQNANRITKERKEAQDRK